MTFPVWIEIVCAECSRTATGQYTWKGQIPLRQMKNEAKKEGFIFNYKEAFCSKDCVDKFVKKN